MAHAKYCYQNYPTIVNNIPKEKNVYSNTMDDYAAIDNGLAKSQTDIGESSNLAQIAQTYDCTFGNPKFADYVCILSVLAQCAIDNAKRRFDVDIAGEIARIKTDMDVSSNKYPDFWRIIKRGFKRQNINPDLHCPMNYLCGLELNRVRDCSPTIPMDELFIKHPLEKSRKQSRKVEELIEKYSLDVYNYNIFHDDSEYIMLRSDFEDLLSDIKKVYISSNYSGLMSWLIDRSFMISEKIKAKRLETKSNLSKNRPLLLKTLYDINKDSFLKCFKIGDKNA
ncbi:MAG: hypothetical protein ACLTWK_11920 [Eisenbergiella sp.]